MNQEIALYWISQSMEIALLVVTPILMTGLIIGLVVSMFQAVTSIQEMTLSYVPKMLAVATLLYFFSPWLLQKMTEFSIRVFEYIPNVAQ
jgi:flagellar biosynthetic protein FliQ